MLLLRWRRNFLIHLLSLFLLLFLSFRSKIGLFFLHILHEILKVEVSWHSTFIDDFISFFNLGVVLEHCIYGRVLNDSLNFLHKLRIREKFLCFGMIGQLKVSLQESLLCLHLLVLSCFQVTLKLLIFWLNLESLLIGPNSLFNPIEIKQRSTPPLMTSRPVAIHLNTSLSILKRLRIVSLIEIRSGTIREEHMIIRVTFNGLSEVLDSLVVFFVLERFVPEVLVLGCFVGVGHLWGCDYYYEMLFTRHKSLQIILVNSINILYTIQPKIK